MNKYGITFSNGAKVSAIFDTRQEAFDYGNKVKALYGVRFDIYEKGGN